MSQLGSRTYTILQCKTSSSSAEIPGLVPDHHLHLRRYGYLIGALVVDVVVADVDFVVVVVVVVVVRTRLESL